MKKNVASQVVGAQMVSASDGSAFTGAVACHVTGDGGTQAVGSVGFGACAHEGNGFHTYAPAQAETNYDHVAFTFIGTGAVPATVQIYTGFPQTGDSYGRLGAPAGASVSADIATIDGNVDAILADTGTDGVVLAGTPNVNAAQISGSSTAADNLERGALGLVLSAVNDASASTTAFVTDLTEATNDHYNGRIITFTSGALAGQATTVTDYNGTTKAVTVVALTEAPADNDQFVIS